MGQAGTSRPTCHAFLDLEWCLGWPKLPCASLPNDDDAANFVNRAQPTPTNTNTSTLHSARPRSRQTSPAAAQALPPNFPGLLPFSLPSSAPRRSGFDCLDAPTSQHPLHLKHRGCRHAADSQNAAYTAKHTTHVCDLRVTAHCPLDYTVG